MGRYKEPHPEFVPGEGYSLAMPSSIPSTLAFESGPQSLWGAGIRRAYDGLLAVFVVEGRVPTERVLAGIVGTPIIVVTAKVPKVTPAVRKAMARRESMSTVEGAITAKNATAAGAVTATAEVAATTGKAIAAAAMAAASAMSHRFSCRAGRQHCT